MIPSILATALATTLGSALAGRFMVFQPFLLVAGAIGAIGCGLMLTFDLNPNLGAIIGFQILFGIGVGLGVQLPNLVATVTSTADDVALTISSVACKHNSQSMRASLQANSMAFLCSLHDACWGLGRCRDGCSFEQHPFAESSAVCSWP